MAGIVQHAAGGVVAALLTVAPGLAPWINSSLGLNTTTSVTCGFGQDIGNGVCRGYLTSGSSWTVPADWNNTNNTIEVIGGGAAGGSYNYTDGGETAGVYNPGGGGGGGAYAKKTNVALTPGASVSYEVGAGGVAQAPQGSSPHNTASVSWAGGDTWFYSRNIVFANGGGGAYKSGNSSGPLGAGGSGGSAALSVGDVVYDGGNGGQSSSMYVDGGGYVQNGGVGGCAASKYANGNTRCSGGGAGPANQQVHPINNLGAEYDQTHGSGVGGGGANPTNDGLCMAPIGQVGGLYGGGGGGGTIDQDCIQYNMWSGGSGGRGAPGLIVITYASANNDPDEPEPQPDPNDPSGTGGAGTGGATQSSGSPCQSYPICSTDGIRVVDSCTGTTISDCSTHGTFWTCSGGACYVPRIDFESFGATWPSGQHFTATGHLQATPILVASGNSARLYWQVVNASSCTVAGTNGYSIDALASGSQGQDSGPIRQRTVFTLSCNAHTGAIPATVAETATVNIVPSFQER